VLSEGTVAVGAGSGVAVLSGCRVAVLAGSGVALGDGMVVGVLLAQPLLISNAVARRVISKVERLIVFFSEEM